MAPKRRDSRGLTIKDRTRQELLDGIAKRGQGVMFTPGEARAELRRRTQLAARPNRGRARPGADTARREIAAREAARTIARFNSPVAQRRAALARARVERDIEARRAAARNDPAANAALARVFGAPAPRAASPTAARQSDS